MKQDRIVLKPNPDQRATLDYLKNLVGTEELHGEDQKTIYWALDAAARIYHLFALDQLLAAKGFQVRDPLLFKSMHYQNVAKNAQKRVPDNMPKVYQAQNKGSKN